ncbi:MAG: hypothetical protein RLZZ142_654, partial [Verrucomicrobiota bacterium]
RRWFLKGGMGLLAGMVSAGAYGMGVEPERLGVERIRIPAGGEGLGGLEGMRVVALSDFHLHPFTQSAFLREAFQLAGSLKPDLVVLLGDFVDADAAAVEEFPELLREMNPRLGVFGVLGNHDRKKGARVVLEGMRKGGVEMLVNRGVLLGEGHGVWIGGLDSCAGRPDLEMALEGRPEKASTLLMAHEPDVADAVARDGRVHVQLSGHSHGGQINVPGVVHGALPEWGRKYAFGSYRVGSLFLHTSRGLGMTGFPMRFRSPPEVTQLDCG